MRLLVRGSVVKALGLSCSMWDLSSPTRDRTWAPCIGSTEFYPLDHHGSPSWDSLLVDSWSWWQPDPEPGTWEGGWCKKGNWSVAGVSWPEHEAEARPNSEVTAPAPPTITLSVGWSLAPFSPDTYLLASVSTTGWASHTWPHILSVACTLLILSALECPPAYP